MCVIDIYQSNLFISFGTSMQNDFNFEKRDWMTVKQNELPTGSQLVRNKSLMFGFLNPIGSWVNIIFYFLFLVPV